MAGREGRRRTPQRRRSSFRTIAFLTLLPIGGLLVFLIWNFAREHVVTAGDHPQQSPPSVAAAALGRRLVPSPPPALPPPSPKPEEKTKPRGGEIVLILDDVGFEHQPLGDAMSIDPNINFAVLPNGQKADEFATVLHARGFEILCHLPMEPEDPQKSPGPGAVLTSMSDDEIVRATRSNVGSIPFARGVNNHMGSRATADRRVMTDVLGALPKGYYFVDSMTSPKSIAGKLARQMSIKTTSRNVFLDDVETERAIRKQLAHLSLLAADRGVAVGIGHMYPATVKVLAEEAPGLRSRGFRFVRASEAVD